MQTNEAVAEKVAKALRASMGRIVRELEEPEVDLYVETQEVSDYSEHYMSNDKGLYVVLSDAEGRKAELGIKIQVHSESEFGEEYDA